MWKTNRMIIERIHLIWILGILLYLAWAYGLWYFAQSRRKTGRRNFYLLLFSPLMLSVAISLYMGGFLLVASSGVIGFVLLFLSLLYLIFWGITLYEVAGDSAIGWFILLLIPALSWLWLIYWFGQWKK